MTDEKKSAKLSGMLGLAMRAGKVTLGTEQICAALPKGKINLVCEAHLDAMVVNG